MDIIRHYASYAAIIAIFWLAVFLVPKCSRVSVPPDYYEIDGIEGYRSYRLDESITVRQLDTGDGICYQLGTASDRRTYFGWVAGKAGDEVAINDGMVKVNGTDVLKVHKMPNVPNCPPVLIPDNHFFVLSNAHANDSIVHGPLPAIALRGRIGELP
jgi:hypothetical protein